MISAEQYFGAMLSAFAAGTVASLIDRFVVHLSVWPLVLLGFTIAGVLVILFVPLERDRPPRVRLWRSRAGHAQGPLRTPRPR